MKQHRIFIFASLLLCTAFISCNTGDEPGGNGTGNESGEGNENVTPAANPLVGYWESENDNSDDLLLFDDGTCISPSKVDGRVKSDGKWAFDEKTQYLSNTATQKTFLLTVYDESSIMGVDIYNNKTVAFKKDLYSWDAPYCIMAGEWETKDGLKLNISYGVKSLSGDLVPDLPKDTQRKRYFGAAMRLFANSSTQQYEYEIIWDGEHYAPYPDNCWYDDYFESPYKGTITVKNPYSPSKCEVTFTGVLEGTYKRMK